MAGGVEEGEELKICDDGGEFLLQLDLSGMALEVGDDERSKLERAHEAMAALEGGAIANPGEGRMVGHYWLRSPGLAPGDLGSKIEEATEGCAQFAALQEVRERFDATLLVGIGGSALGPQLLRAALASRSARPLHFIDNTDPVGSTELLATLDLERTLCLIVSKSGGTIETMNGLGEVRAAFAERGLEFERNAVAVTMDGSALDRMAAGWLGRFPQFEWVGGRTSIFSTVGLLPAALLGVDGAEMLRGAAALDTACRERTDNPAAMLALAWLAAGKRGERSMVVLPYRDRLELLGRYLQQLVMESLGKRLDLEGRVVEEGLAVYGNKGSTDQHAFVQQLVEGRRDSFALFVTTLEDPANGAEVHKGHTSGEVLLSMLLGTRRALRESGRHSATLILPRLSPACFGALIALFERAVGCYAAMVGINAYDQPGVEAGKRAANLFLAAMRREEVELTAEEAALLEMYQLANDRKVTDDT